MCKLAAFLDGATLQVFAHARLEQLAHVTVVTKSPTPRADLGDVFFKRTTVVAIMFSSTTTQNNSNIDNSSRHCDDVC